MVNQTLIRAQHKKLVDRIEKMSVPHPLRIGVDGITASGKTTFADSLAQMLSGICKPVIRASIDGFHNPKEVRYRNSSETPESYYQDSFNYAAIRRELLEPLSRVSEEPASLRTAVYDFRTESDVTDESRLFSKDSILIFDGVMLFREEIDDCWDFRIYMDTRMQTAFERGVPRDAKTDEEQMTIGKKYLYRYFPGQRIYQSRFLPHKKADVIVMNENPASPYIRFRKVS